MQHIETTYYLCMSHLNELIFALNINILKINEHKIIKIKYENFKLIKQNYKINLIRNLTAFILIPHAIYENLSEIFPIPYVTIIFKVDLYIYLNDK